MSISVHRPAAERQKSRGELIFDVLLVVGIAGYLVVAHRYPPIGREIPTVVGVVALAAAVLQLIGWFVPGLWKITHGAEAGEPERSPGDAAPGAAAVGNPDATATEATGLDTSTDATMEQAAEPQTAEKPLDVPIAMAWAAGFLGAILVLGYVVAVPLFFLGYFAARRAWWLAIGSAVVMGLITRFLFESLLGIPLPGGFLIGPL